MLVQIFGAKFSPTCANFALKQTAAEFGHLFEPGMWKQSNFLILPLPALLEVLCFRVRFRFLTFGIFRLQMELVASEFASASSLFHQSAFASTKI